ncbi:MAG: heme exporter protein CcmD [Alphaproteobacteria bacterium]
MDSLTTWVAMGGHAAYVWPAYGLALFLLAGSVLAAWRAMRRYERALSAAEAERAASVRRRS